MMAEIRVFLFFFFFFFVNYFLFCYPYENNLIFFIFIRFPAILLVKTVNSYFHELCTGYFT